MARKYDLIVYLGNGVFANAEVFNQDFSILVRLQRYIITVCPGNAERKAFHIAIGRCLLFLG